MQASVPQIKEKPVELDDATRAIVRELVPKLIAIRNWRWQAETVDDRANATRYLEVLARRILDRDIKLVTDDAFHPDNPISRILFTKIAFVGHESDLPDGVAATRQAVIGWIGEERWKAHIEAEVALKEQRERLLAEQMANTPEGKALAAMRNLDGFGDDLEKRFLGIIRKALGKLVQLEDDPEPIPLRDAIRKLVAAGYSPGHAEGKRALVHESSGRFYRQRHLTKVGIDFAAYLVRKLESKGAGDAKTEG